jgi:hypothetical protein
MAPGSKEPHPDHGGAGFSDRRVLVVEVTDRVLANGGGGREVRFKVNVGVLVGG